MSDMQPKFIDPSEHKPEQPGQWPAVIIPKERIDSEVARLAAAPKPDNGRREAMIVHPLSSAPGLGLAPGIRVTLSVLNPGEQSQQIRHNSTQINFCIDGGGYSVMDGKRIDFTQYDVWNTPSYAIYRHVNDTDSVQVRLTYSNAPLLEKMNAHIVEDDPPLLEEVAAASEHDSQEDDRRKSPYGTFQLTDDGAWMMPYEILINPPTVQSKALHWPWAQVKENVDKLEALGKEYVGRRLYLLYNPITGRTNGTTPNFFATMTIRPPKIIDRPHRHISAAINYYFSGSGYSVVAGQRYEWKAGDLMLSAPGWAVHNHASYDEYVYELTVQDQPLNIAMESLLWQENLKMPAAVLGAQTGFATNRTKSA
ncbi:MAG: gentisate 1,2-dioxygenase [Gammaproteobacteria bacterium]|jgi:gentisate 1,2-dioxygenase